MANDFFFSLFTAVEPTVLTKSFRLNKDGLLTNKTGGKLIKGAVKRIKLTGPVEFSAKLEQLQQNQALSFGLCEHGDVDIVPEQQVEKTPDAYSRSRENFSFLNGPGIMMIDYDPADDDPKPLERAQLVEIMGIAVQGLATAPMVLADSAGGHIYHKDGTEHRGRRGLRVYLFIKDASDIPRAGQVLFDRLVLNGQGRIIISKSGALLKRTLVDGSVYQPERLDFAAGAKCLSPLAQNRPLPEVLNRDIEPLDTKAIFKDLSDDEFDRISQIWAELAAQRQPEADQVKEQFTRKRVKEITERLGKEVDGLDEKIRKAVETLVLPDEFLIYIDGGGVVSVGEIMAESCKYHGQKCADPLEPDYQNDSRIARIYSSDGRIHSFAHGGTTYHMQEDTAKIFAGYHYQSLIPSVEQDIWENDKELDREKLKKASMTERFLFVVEGSKVADLAMEPQHSLLRIEDFNRAFANLPPVKRGSNKQIAATKDWLWNNKRQTVRGELYHPGKPRIYKTEGALWFNPFYKPIWPNTDDRDLVPLLSDHFELIIPEEKERKLFYHWLAYTVHVPEIRVAFTPLLISRYQGTGRGWIVKLIEKLIGPWNCSHIKIKTLAGQGNDGQYHNYLYQSLFCSIPEIKVEKNRYDIDDAIRDKLTDSPLNLNIKYGPNGTYEIFTNFLMASNHPDALIIPEVDRRIFVTECPSKPPSEDYFSSHLYPALANERFLAQVFSFLKDYIGAPFNPYMVAPMTPAKRRIVHFSKSSTALLYEDMIDHPKIADVISYNIFTEFVNAKADFAPDHDQVKKLAVLRENATLLNDGKKIKVRGNSLRLWAIRNKQKWLKADTEDLRDELNRNAL